MYTISPTEACNSLPFDACCQQEISVVLANKPSKLHVCIINQCSSADSQLNSFNYNPILGNSEYLRVFLLEDLSSNAFRLVTDLAVT